MQYIHIILKVTRQHKSIDIILFDWFFLVSWDLLFHLPDAPFSANRNMVPLCIASIYSPNSRRPHHPSGIRFFPVCIHKPILTKPQFASVNRIPINWAALVVLPASEESGISLGRQVFLKDLFDEGFHPSTGRHQVGTTAARCRLSGWILPIWLCLNRTNVKLCFDKHFIRSERGGRNIFVIHRCGRF